MDVRSRKLTRGRARESSPERAKVNNMMQPKVKPIRKVQVVYYLSRNGQLEHPHYMEVTHLADQQLRLRDFVERLTILRGKAMPSLYSWSCKRSYKNGYVWNDLAENDAIYPSEGAEYVLKGSELVERCADRFQQLQLSHSNRQLIQESNLHQKTRQHSPSPPTPQHNYEYGQYRVEAEEQEEQEEEEPQGNESNELEYEDEEKKSYTSSTTTSHSRCSRGVSTDELLLDQNNASNSVKLKQPSNDLDNKGSISKRFEDGDPIEPSGRSSVLLQLISCGNMAVTKAKNNVPSLKAQQQGGKATNGEVISTGNYVVRKSNSGESDHLRKGVLYKTTLVSKSKVGDDAQEEENIIRYMSENPRFGNMQSEEKEYFSGSIVESMSENRDLGDPVGLKRSNSYGEDRSSKAGLDEEETAAEEDIKDRAAVKGKCIPRKISSLTSKQMKK